MHEPGGTEPEIVRVGGDPLHWHPASIIRDQSAFQHPLSRGLKFHAGANVLRTPNHGDFD